MPAGQEALAESTRADERALEKAEWLVQLGTRIQNWLGMAARPGTARPGTPAQVAASAVAAEFDRAEIGAAGSTPSSQARDRSGKRRYGSDRRRDPLRRHGMATEAAAACMVEAQEPCARWPGCKIGRATASRPTHTFKTSRRTTRVHKLKLLRPEIKSEGRCASK